MKHNTEFPYPVMLFLLGGFILIRCKYKECAEEIKRNFVLNVVEKAWSTPDVMITCDWKHAGRYLFRSRPRSEPDILEGVKILSKGKASFQPWSFYDPPIPPYSISPFKERFIGLHGAAVKTPKGNGLLILGKRGSGKTTTSLELSNRYGCHLLTDETILIHKRSNIVEPFLRQIKQRQSENDEIKPVIKPANEACKNVAMSPMLATQAIFLERKQNLFKSYMRNISKAEALKFLLKHHIDLGCNLDEAMFTLAYLANTMRFSIFYYSTHDELLQLSSKVIALDYEELT